MQQRIISRKLVLMYLHQYFFQNFEQKNIFEQKIDIEGWEHQVEYILENFFLWKEYDFEYIKSVINALPQVQMQIFDKIKNSTQSFSLQDMDVIDIALLWLWEAEFFALKTPRKVLINELVELAKRYGDDWSYKLINWIWNKIFLDDTQNS